MLSTGFPIEILIQFCMKIRVGKWGNILGIRIPVVVCKQMGLHHGSDLNAVLFDEIPVLCHEPPKSNCELESLLAQITLESIHK